MNFEECFGGNFLEKYQNSLFFLSFQNYVDVLWFNKARKVKTIAVVVVVAGKF